MKSIRTKLIFWISVLFVFIGALLYIPLSNRLPKLLTSQILKRDVEIAKYLSKEAKEFLLLNDSIALSILLRDNLDSLEDARYLFIQTKDGNIIAHTFDDGFPKGLLSLQEAAQPSHRIKEFSSDGRKIYDIAVPILEGQIGTLHLGVSMELDKRDIAAIAKINYYVAAVILAGLGFGIFIFLVMGFLFSNQIIKLKGFASKIGSGELDAKIDIQSRDEIGVLASAFNDMAAQLKEKIEEIKRLNKLEERNKVALDLHDGCAQDLADIIKRLELCEKLFKLDRPKAFGELETLKKNTRNVLNETRQVISNLSLPEDADFDLLYNLHNYMKNYQQQNDINVTIDIGSLEHIPSSKARMIFYIITEALTNIRKHAYAKNAYVHLEYKDNKELIIDIKDDGKGFDVDEAQFFASSYGKFGLTSIRQRTISLGGKVVINSTPNQGTEIHVRIPLGEKVA